MPVISLDSWWKTFPFRPNRNSDLGRTVSTAPTLANTPVQTPEHSPDRSNVVRPAERSEGEVSTDSKPPEKAPDRSHCNGNLRLSWMTPIIVTCFFVSGMIDAVAFNSWNCFVGMQSGNTVFVALGISHLPVSAHRHQYLKSLVSIGSFCLGVVSFNTLHRWPTGLGTMPTSRRRVVFTISFLLQTILIIIAAALITTDVVSNQAFRTGQFSSGSSRNTHSDANYHDLIPVALLAFHAAGPVCLSRNLNVIELPTIVISTLYHDFCADLLGTRQSWKQADHNLWTFLTKTNLRQEKRLFSILAFFFGAFVGGEMYRSPARMAGAIWLAAGLKGGLFLALLLWPKEKNGKEKVSNV